MSGVTTGRWWSSFRAINGYGLEAVRVKDAFEVMAIDAKAASDRGRALHHQIVPELKNLLGKKEPRWTSVLTHSFNLPQASLDEAATLRAEREKIIREGVKG